MKKKSETMLFAVFILVLAGFAAAPVQAVKSGSNIVQTYTLDKAPARVKDMVKQCSSIEDINITKYKNHYWVYTNALGSGNGFTFHMEKRKSGDAKLTIQPEQDTASEGYALLSVPAKYKNFTAECGNYSTTVKKKAAGISTYHCDDDMVYRWHTDAALNRKELKSWLKQCKSSTGIYISQYEGRYFVYTNAIGSDKDFTFERKTDEKSGVTTIKIAERKNASGEGYALLAVPMSKKIVAKCGKYSAAAVEQQDTTSVEKNPIKDDNYYDVLTYRLKIRELPDKIKKWVKQCDSPKKIYAKKYDDRYWIYTKAIGAGNSYTFSSGSGGRNSHDVATLTIRSNKEVSGDGYALLSSPVYSKLTITCGKVSKTIYTQS